MSNPPPRSIVHPVFLASLLIVGGLAAGLAVSYVLVPTPTIVKDVPGYSGISASDVRPLFERLDLPVPKTGDLIWPGMLKAMERMLDRVEELERRTARPRSSFPMLIPTSPQVVEYPCDVK